MHYHMALHPLKDPATVTIVTVAIITAFICAVIAFLRWLYRSRGYIYDVRMTAHMPHALAGGSTSG